MSKDDSLTSFGRHNVNPHLNKPFKGEATPKATPLAQSPVVARIRKTQFGSTDTSSTPAAPQGVDTNKLQKAAARVMKPVKLSIHKI